MDTRLSQYRPLPVTMPEKEAIQDAAEQQSGWQFLWVLFVFKIVTVFVTLWAAGVTGEASLLLSLTTWPWLIIAGIGIAGPLAFKFRLHRVRARRDALQRAEWMLEPRSRG